ncbi:MAG: DUF1501 domain-containing protein [Haliscomenobacter sp.]|nr:DUF1501 domain-containing protein [Haliscomenobacter sp.]MBK8655009.1 DUF1501 domain-containing protein [Haliscomenobacter sp.]MBP9075987.1 DUF1501 domain-containing protein [Haliscomenobacter sp.]MBP9872685.1 DUF1501 domain-containing protein [Haliscomenobacter sp.]
MRRREFLRQSGLASTALFVPAFLNQLQFGKLQQRRSGKILIVIQLSGGNDGLNTIVPYRNDLYYKFRPSLGIPPEQVLKVDADQGFNPALESLRSLYDDGLVTVLNSVGYPNPDRSHFRSMDIWHSASSSQEYWNTGWLGRYLDSNCAGCATPYHAIELDDYLSLALKGAQRTGFAMSEPAQLKRTTENRFLKAIGQQHPASEDHDHVAYLYKTMASTQSSANYLFEQSKVYASSVAYPQTPFGRDLKTVAELITADTDTKIYYVSLTGFDTHANQKVQQERLLKQYADGVNALVTDLKQQGLLQDTLILTFSEFGRRVSQNASNGTDHGTANNLFLIGGSLKKPGFFNEAPDLTTLDEEDLIYKLDFRSVYSTVLKQWLQADVPDILGSDFPALALLG